MTPDAADALGPDDYAALHGLLMAGDPQGLALAKKLTAPEQQAFFDYQRSANKGKGERTREDNSLLGVPPELAVVSGVGVARAMAGAGAGVVTKAAAGAKAAIAHAAPTLKYEATKTILEKAGVPTPLAVVAATAVAGYKKGGKAAPPVAAAEIPPTIGEAAAAAPAAPTPAPAPAAPVAAAAPTNARPTPKLMNELAIEARRARITLTPEMKQTAIDAVGNGATPQQAVRAFAPLAPTEAAAAADAAPAWTPTKIRLTAEESKVAAKLIQNGKTDQEVQQAIEAARALQKRFGSPTDATVRTTIRQRNLKG